MTGCSHLHRSALPVKSPQCIKRTPHARKLSHGNTIWVIRRRSPQRPNTILRSRSTAYNSALIRNSRVVASNAYLHVRAANHKRINLPLLGNIRNKTRHVTFFIFVTPRKQLPFCCYAIVSSAPLPCARFREWQYAEQQVRPLRARHFPDQNCHCLRRQANQPTRSRR